MSDDERARLTALVRGRVQGVGFRAFVIDRARGLDLNGYVRNLPDHRTVEVVAEGSRERLESLVGFLRQGPRAARVDGVDVAWGLALGNLGSFGARF